MCNRPIVEQRGVLVDVVEEFVKYIERTLYLVTVCCYNGQYELKIGISKFLWQNGEDEEFYAWTLYFQNSTAK